MYVSMYIRLYILQGETINKFKTEENLKIDLLRCNGGGLVFIRGQKSEIEMMKSLRKILTYLDNINVQHNLDHENAMTEACANMNKLLNNTYHLKLGKGMLGRIFSYIYIYMYMYMWFMYIYE